MVLIFVINVEKFYLEDHCFHSNDNLEEISGSDLGMPFKK